MKHKGRILIALTLGIVCLAAFTLAYAESKAPDKEITINSSDIFKERKQTPVPFAHSVHKTQKCTDCHHEFKDGKNVWQEGQEVKKCSACHKLEADGKIVKLYAAYHGDYEHSSCVGCHKRITKEKKKAGPTACAKCHPKKDGAAAGGEKK